MKKLPLLFVLTIIAQISIAQNYFTLTENGLVPTSDPEAGFIVIDKPDQPQQQLFDLVRNAATQFYKSPKDVISESGNSVITLNGVSTSDVLAKKGFGVLDVRMNYTITFQFKDGKIRVDAPSINRMTSESQTLGGGVGSRYMLLLSTADRSEAGDEAIFIFKKGKVKEEVKSGIETFFDALVNKMTTADTTNNEDW